MIARTWRGWTRLEDAARYESVFRTIVLPHLDSVEGCRQAFLFRRDVNDEVEFFVLTLFDSMDAVRRFAGENYEAAVVSDEAKEVLKHFEERVSHYEIAATKNG